MVRGDVQVGRRVVELNRRKVEADTEEKLIWIRGEVKSAREEKTVARGDKKGRNSEKFRKYSAVIYGRKSDFSLKFTAESRPFPLYRIGSEKWREKFIHFATGK